MTTYIVGEGGDYPAPWDATRVAKPGDTVSIRPGVYRGKLVCGTPGVRWQFEPGAVIDGGWNGKTMQSGFSSQVELSAPGVVFTGAVVRNCPGRGVLIDASDVTFEACHVENTFHGAIAVIGDGKPISGVKVTNSMFTQMSRSWAVGDRDKGVNGGFQIHNVTDSLIAGNECSYGWGECFNLGRNARRVVVEGNVAHSFNHVLCYLNRCQDCTVRGNTFYHLPDAPQVTDRNEASAGIVFGDERGAKLEKFAPQEGNVVTGNLVVNCGKLVQVRNNALSGEGAGYDTQLKDTRIEGNTFVAGPLTLVGIEISENQRGRRHEGSTFRDNVVYGTAANMSNAPGVAFERNGWTYQPGGSMRGEGDAVGDLLLLNPAPPVDRIERDNYRPRPDSPLLRVGGYIGALPPAGLPEPPPDVDPPPASPLDVAALRAQVDAALNELDAAGGNLALAAATMTRAASALETATATLNQVLDALDAARES